MLRHRAKGLAIEVSAADHDRLERIVADRNSPQTHVWRARIILATATGLRYGGDHVPGRPDRCRRSRGEHRGPCDRLVVDQAVLCGYVTA